MASTGNLLLTHRQGNQDKADRPPMPCEVLFLFAVNRRLGYPEADTRQWDRPYVGLEEYARA